MLRMTTAYHPQDGQINVINCILQCFCAPQALSIGQVVVLGWMTLFSISDFSWDESLSGSMGNYHLPCLTMLLDLALVEHELTTLDYILANLKVNLLESQTNIKTYADQHHIHIHFIWVTWFGLSW